MAELNYIGLKGFAMAVYVYSYGQAVFQHYNVLKTIENKMAALSGLVYKASKDVDDVDT